MGQAMQVKDVTEIDPGIIRRPQPMVIRQTKQLDTT